MASSSSSTSPACAAGVGATEPCIGAICELLGAVQSSKTDVRMAAEQKLNEALTTQADETLRCLAAVLTLAEVPQELRQEAAVLLRQSVAGTTQREAEVPSEASERRIVWTRIHDETKAIVRLQLLLAVEHGLSTAVRRIAGSVVVAIIEEDYDDLDGIMQDWPEALISLSRFVSETSSDELRILGLGMLGDLSAMLGDDLVRPSSQAQLLSLLCQCIEGGSPEVRAAGVQLLLQLIVSVEPSTLTALAPLVPTVASVLQVLATSQPYEDAMKETLEALTEAVEEQPSVFKGPSMEKLWSTLMQLCRHEVEGIFGSQDVRHGAMEAALSLVLALPKDFCQPDGQPLLKQFVRTNLDWMLELEEDVDAWTSQADDADDEDADGGSPEMAEENFDRIGAAFQKKGKLEEVLLPIVFKELRLMSESSAQTWAQLRSAIMVVSQIVEYIEEEAWIDQCVRFVGQYVHHPHPRVRYAAFQAIGQVAHDHEPYVQQVHHEELLPAVLTGLDDSNVRVAAASAGAFAALGEELDDKDLSPFAEALVTKLFGRLKEARTQNMQEQSLSALAVVAEVLEEKFLPFYSHLMPLLKHIIAVCTSSKQQVLRGKAFECASLVGHAVGKEAFKPDAAELMEVMVRSMAAGFKPDDPTREFVQDAIGRVADTMGKDFKIYVPALLECIKEVLSQAPQEAAVSRALAAGGPNSSVNLEVDICVLTSELKTAVVNEMKDALIMLRQIVQSLEEDYCEFIPVTCQMLLCLTKFATEADVQEKAFLTWESLIECSRHVAGLAGPWELGKAVCELITTTLTGRAVATNRMIPQKALAGLQAQATGVSGIIRKAGKGTLNCEQVVQLSEVVVNLLDQLGATIKGKRSRKRAGDEEAEDDEDLGLDLDEVPDEEEGVTRETVRFCLADVLGSLMRSNREDFAQAVLPTFAEMLQLLLRNESSPSDKSLALYIVDDIVDSLGELSVPYWNRFMESTVAAIPSRSPAVRQYAASIAGHASRQPVFVQIAPLAASNLATVVAKQAERHRKRRAVSSEAKQAALATDACIRALGLVCENQETSLGPNVGQAWKVWLSSLPLRYDEDEGQKAHAQLLELVIRRHPAVTSAESLPQVLSIFAEIYKGHFSNVILDDEIACNLHKVGERMIESIIAQLPKRHAKKVQQILQDCHRSGM